MTPQTARKIRMARYRQARINNGGKVTEHGIVGGHLMVPAEPVRVMLQELHQRLTWLRIAELSGVSAWAAERIGNGRAGARIKPSTARAVERLWCDYCAPVKVDKRRLPAGPLLGLVVARYGSINASGLNRQLHRLAASGLSVYQADEWAQRFGVLPEELWGSEWLEVA